MACYYPIPGWRSKERSKDGLRPIVFNVSQGLADRPVNVPCGRCVGCRLERARQWAIRCMHEASMYEENAFITLTYNNQNLPCGKTLVKDDWVLFMKRLRERFKGRRFKFYMCGEYGPTRARPHFHACLFGLDFDDRYLWSYSKKGQPLYRSPLLEAVWDKGWSSIGAVTYESASYVARYILDKTLGEYAWFDYLNVTENGEWNYVLPEFSQPSLGVGKSFFDAYFDDIYPADEVIVNGKSMRPPRYYDKLLAKKDAKLFRQVKARRQAAGGRENETSSRHRVREYIANQRVQLLPRNVEEMEDAFEDFHGV